MTELGVVLQLLHESPSRWRAIRMRGTEWIDGDIGSLALARQMFGPGTGAFSSRGHGLAGKGQTQFVPFGPSGGAGGSGADISMDEILSVFGVGDGGNETTGSWCFWQKGDRKRAEYGADDDRVVVAYQGDTYWSWSRSTGGRTNAGRSDESHGLGPAPELLDTASLAAQLQLRLLGRGELIGRPVLEVVGEPRPVREPFSSMTLLGHGGADEYRLAVDADRGVLLRTEARLDGRPFRIVKVEEIGFDEDFPADTFTVDLPKGESFDDTIDHEITTIAELPGLVPFKVFVPARRLGRPHVRISRRREHGRQATRALVSYTLEDRDAPGPLWLNECAEEDYVEADPRDVWRRQGQLHVVEDQSAGYLRTKVLLVREGTSVLLESTAATLSELIEIAESLTEVPPGR